MKKQLTLAAFIGAAMFLGAADTYSSLYKEAHALRKTDKAASVEKFNSALKLAKNDSDRFYCCYYRAHVRMDEKKYAEAIESAKEALKFAAQPKDGISEQQALANWLIGLAYRYMGKKTQESLDAYRASAKVAPRQSWIFTNSSCAAGDSARMLKKYDEAAQLFKALYECEKADVNSRSEAQFQWALTLIEQKKQQDALKLMEKAEELSPKLSDNSKARIWDARGRAYQSLQKWADAINAYQEMYKYVSKDESYRAFCCLQLASLYTRNKDLANGAKYAQLCIDCKNARWGRDVRVCNDIIASYKKSVKK